MKKHFYAFILLALVGVGASCLAGCETVDATVTITNKDELQQEWRIGDSSRTMELEIEYEGEVQNPSLAIATGELTISSSDTSVILTSGSVLVASGVGDATITASYKGAKDSVNLSILELNKTWTDWEVGNKYALGYDKDGVTWYYDGGVQNNYYGTVSTNPDDAVAVLVEASGNGYTLKLDNGCYLGGSFDGYVDFEWTLTTPYVWDYDEELETFVTTNDETTYALGTTSSYDEITLVDASSSVNYLAHLYTLSENAGVPADLPDPAKWEVGNKYALAYQKGNYIYYYTGGVESTYYGAVSTNASDAAAVLIESSGNGYTLKLDNDCYLGYARNDTHNNFKWDLNEAYVWTYDEELDAFTTKYEESTLALGTTSYNEIAIVDTSNSGNYYARLYELDESATVELPDPAEWTAGNTYALGYQKGNAIYYYDGGVLQTFYGSVTTDLSKAASVLVEAVNEGYSLKLNNNCYLGYAYETGGDGNYHNDFKWDLTEAYVWTYDQTLNTFVTTYNETTYAMGTGSTYDEITIVNTSNSGNYYARLYDLAN